MNDKTIEILIQIIMVPMIGSLLIGIINYCLLRVMFITDKEIKTWDKIPFSLIGGEIEYVRDIAEKNKKSKYYTRIKVAKYCGLVFLGCIFALMLVGVASLI